MTATRAWLAALALVAACRASEAPTSTGSTVGPGGVAPPPPLPAGQQCLPAMICDGWAGCALIGDSKVIAGDRLRAGEPVRVENGCTTGATCLAARAAPSDVTCAPDTIPPKIDPPGYACVWDGKTCSKR